MCWQVGVSGGMAQTVSKKSKAGSSVFGGFADNYAHSLDSKRRLTIPFEWREQVGTPNRLFVMPDFSRRCIRCFPGAEMERVTQKALDLHRSDPQVRDDLRELGRQSQNLPWDTQGRIRIRDELLDFAGLKDQVVMVGTMDSFELWAPENMRDATRVDQARLQAVAQRVNLWGPSSAPRVPHEPN